MRLPICGLKVVLFLIALTVSACEGPVGPPGEPGPPGLDGIDGADGVANLIAVNATFTGADLGISDDGLFAFAGFEAPEITADIVDLGAVLAYFRVIEEPLWLALPFTFQFDADDPDFPEADVQVTYIYAENEFGVQLYSDEPFPFDLLGDFLVKIIIIPPSDVDLQSRLAGVNVSNYEAVADALELTEEDFRLKTLTLR